MKRGKPVILLLTLLLAAIAVVFGRNEIGSQNFPFSLIVISDGAQEELDCMKLGGEFYVFLPGYAKKDQVQIRTNPIYDVFIEGQQLSRGQSCAEFPLDTKLQLYFRSIKNEGYETITFVQSGNVATMFIDIPSGNMDYIHEQKGNAEPGRIRVYTEDGQLNFTGALETVKGRGNMTWLDDKKPYSLKLSQEGDLLGMGKASRWVLLSNSHDRTHLRNKVSYDVAKQANMAYSPDCTWVDLYLNGEYAGLYLLSERNEVHPQRVNIDPDKSFLVSVEPDWRLQEHGYPYVQTQLGTALRIHYSAIPHDTVQQIWQAAENAILAEDGLDPVTGKKWNELIDLDSWARKYLIAEIFTNEDACLASEFYFYDETDGLLHAGPVWDMDVTFNNTEQPWLSTRAILAGRPHLTSVADKNYFYELLQKPEFRTRVETLYRMEFRPLLNNLLEGGLETYVQKTEQAALANQVRWNLQDSAEKIAGITEFVSQRLAFLDDLWIHGEQMFLIQVQEYARVWAFAVYSGETLDFLPDMEGGIWYRTDTDTVLDKTLPVENDLIITAK